MGMNAYVVGLRDINGERHKAMVAAAKALFEVGIHDFPVELKEYFRGYYETSEIVHNPYAGCEVDIPVLESCDRDGCDDYIVEIANLPEGVTHIRFTISY